MSFAENNLIYLAASGDLRLSANRVCWAAQEAAEREVVAAVESFGLRVQRAHAYDPEAGHGFLDSQRRGLDVFATIPAGAPVIVVEAVWQYSHHVLPGLYRHQGPILTVANWSGQWPGLVGLLNLNGSLTKAGVNYSTLWSEDFKDPYFLERLGQWLAGGQVRHDDGHVKPLGAFAVPAKAADLGGAVAAELRRRPAILGVFDEGCMGMYNAIIPDELLHAANIFKERLSQSALFAAMRAVPEAEALAVKAWLDARGMQFKTGTDEATELTEAQLLQQCRMYIAAVRIAHDFGCDAIGIQYQQGLKDICPASDLAEGLLNNVDRPPVFSADGATELYAGNALPHFNEVDECAGVDGLITNRVWKALGLDPENTLHDLRFGEDYAGQFVWVFEISGAAPPQHFIGGYAGAVSERQPPMYFPLGGGSLKGVSKPGEVVWSRVYVQDGRMKADLGMADVVALPQEETERRWRITTPQWPVMHAVLRGVNRDQMMGRHKANHIQVAYGGTEALFAKAVAFREMGIEVSLCGEVN